MCFTCIPGILVSWEIYRARAKPGEPMFGFVARGGIFSYFSHSVQINSIVDAHKTLVERKLCGEVKPPTRYNSSLYKQTLLKDEK